MHSIRKFLITRTQADTFHRDGVARLGRLITVQEAQVLVTRFERLFRGQFETGTLPDEVNWQEGKSDPQLTRQICNGWRADRTIAATVLRADIAQAVAGLMGWNGVRIMQDNVIWKPVGARALNYHQDNAYLQWFEPGEICSVWIALDDIEAANGTMELVRGSHRWGLSEPEGEFHGPDDYQTPMRKRSEELGLTPDILYISVAAGYGSVHHGRTWHGSGPNLGNAPRRSLVIHAMPAESHYQRKGFSKGNGPIYSRYAHIGTDEMDENYFPILWRNDGYRTPTLERYCESDFAGT